MCPGLPQPARARADRVPRTLEWSFVAGRAHCREGVVGLCALERSFQRGRAHRLQRPVRIPPSKRGRQCAWPATTNGRVHTPPPKRGRQCARPGPAGTTPASTVPRPHALISTVCQAGTNAGQRPPSWFRPCRRRILSLRKRKSARSRRPARGKQPCVISSEKRNGMRL